MLHQQQRVADRPRLARGDDALLRAKPLRVGDAAERDEMDVQLPALATIFEDQFNRLRQILPTFIFGGSLPVGTRNLRAETYEPLAVALD